MLYTAPAYLYEPIQDGLTTSQTQFFDLPHDKRHQLYRAYYELVQYVPWKNSPDETFLSVDVQQQLACTDTHRDSTYSLIRLEEFFYVYKRMWNAGQIAPPGSAWHRDNQFSYTMYLNNLHNRDLHLDRSDNKGILVARYENADELVDVDVDLRITDEGDISEYPSCENFLPPDSFRGIMEQKPPTLNEIAVAFPLSPDFMALEELATHDKFKRFLAKPPSPPVSYEEMTDIQKWAVDLGTDTNHNVLYICGKAGSGKTSVALKICDVFKGRVQCGAITGKAASNYNGPTTHSMFGWSHDEFDSAGNELKPDSRKAIELRAFYEGIDVFVIDEVNAMSAASFAMLDETMTAVFNPEHKLNKNRQLPPFGNVKVVFLGDASQLRPVGGAAIYDDGYAGNGSCQSDGN